MVPPGSRQESGLLSTYALAIYRETGDYDAAQDVFNRALAIARKQGDSVLEMRVLADAGLAAWWCLNLTDAVEFARRAVELSQQVDSLRAECQVRSYLARAMAAAGNYSAAHQDLPALVASAERLRDRARIADAYSRNAEICYFTGDWESAFEYCARGLELNDGQPILRSIRAALAYEKGEFADGWAHMQELTDFATRASAALAGFV